MKLSLEQREALADMEKDWEAVMALGEIAVSALRARVLGADLSKGDREIALAKSRYEGAVDVLRILANVKEYVKEPKSGSRKT